MNHVRKQYTRSTTGIGEKNTKKQQPLPPHSLITGKINAKTKTQRDNYRQKSENRRK